MAEIKEYGIDQAVPMEDRHYTFLDMIATWVGANANTGSWFVGGVVAALGLGGALGVIFIANPIAYIIMALVGYMGFKVGTTSMGLTRASFGIKGSILPSILNSIQFVGWCAVNTFIAAISMSFLFNQFFGWPAMGQEGSWWVLAIGVLIASILQIVMVVTGGSHSIKKAENLAVICLVVLTIWETKAILTQWDFNTIMSWSPPKELAMPFGKAMDVMAAFSLAWVPAIAEFTRYSKDKASSTWAPMIGANVALFWFAIVGTLGVIATTLSSGKFDPNMSDPSSIVGSLGLGWVAFLVLILATVTTNAVNIYAAGMSLLNIAPKVKPANSLWMVSIVATFVSMIPIMVSSFLNSFILFLDYVGFVFAPLFAIMIVDFYILRKQKYDWSQANLENGIYWYTNGVNWNTILTWGIGAIFFLVIRKVDFIMGSVGAIYSTLLVTAILYYFIGKSSVKQLPAQNIRG